MEAKTERYWQTPDRKVTVGAFAAAVAMLLVWFTEGFGVNVPPGVEGALTILIMGGVQYFTPNRKEI